MRPAGLKNRLSLASHTCHAVTCFLDADAQTCHAVVQFLRPAGFKNRLERYRRALFLRPAGLKKQTFINISNLPCCHLFSGCRPQTCHAVVQFLRPAGLKNRLERYRRALFLRPAGLKIETRGSQKQTCVNISNLPCCRLLSGCRCSKLPCCRSLFETRGSQKQTRAIP